MEKLTIELKFYAEDPEQREAILASAMLAAKQIYTAAILVSGKRQPDIGVSLGEFFAETKQIELVDDDE